MAKKMVDFTSLAHQRSSTAPSLPGPLGQRVSKTEPEQEQAPAVEPTEGAAVPAQEPAKKPTPARKTPAKKTQTKNTKQAPAKGRGHSKKQEERAPEQEPEELTSLDGRPARLWDTSGGQMLPDGWATIAVERVARAWHRSKAFRRNAMLPDNIYDACHTYIYQQAQLGGLELTLSNLAEAAFEQIPMDDPDGIERLLDSLPDQYFDRSQSPRPRTFQLLEPTFDQLKNLARMLRAQGFNGRAGLVQTAVLRDLLLDLGVENVD